MRRITKSKLFGTDGIRARVGNFPLDDRSLIKLGNSIGEIFRGFKILIGIDTRASGERIKELIAAGISSRAEVFYCGVIPTPGISYIIGHSHFDYGIMITASHNPYYDNGIKIFNSRGEKISPDIEEDIEDIFSSIGRLGKDENNREHVKTENINNKNIYKDFLLEQASGLKGKKQKIVVDCAHGAVYEIVPAVFKETGFDAEIINSTPDGNNINRDSGSTNPENLRERVAALKADIGISFDGDGDRVIFADNNRNVLDGDHTLYVISRYLLETNKNFNKIVVGTVMGNLGLEKALSEMRIKYIRTPVGDYNVYQEMKRVNSMIGGEQSGHTILRSLQQTGDGILTAIYFLKALSYFDLKPTEIFNQLSLYPQVTRNIKIRKKKDIDSWDELRDKIEDFNDKHGKNSRIIIRYSGTEPKIRVMIESEHSSVIQENLEIFENLIKSEIGG